MRLPIQSQPVERTMPSHPFADRGVGSGGGARRPTQRCPRPQQRRRCCLAKALKVPIFTTIPVSPMPAF